FASAILETHVAQLDPAGQPTRMNRLDRLRDAGPAVEDLEDALRAGAGALHRGAHAQHRLDAAVEARDVGEERRQHAHGYLAVVDAAAGEGPDDKQAKGGQQRHRRAEERPDAIEPVAGLEDALVLIVETVDLARLLRE